VPVFDAAGEVIAVLDPACRWPLPAPLP
jgi:hypothetical protein